MGPSADSALFDPCSVTVVMSEPNDKAVGPLLGGRFRFGLKRLFATVLALALAFGWVGCENRRAQRQSRLVAVLQDVGVQPILEEPTALAFFIKKRFPGREEWVREHLGEGWLSRPTVFLCSELTDEHVPYATERLKRLGTVREVHYQSRELTKRGIDTIRRSLPGVGVVPRDNPSLQRYYNSQVKGAHFAVGGLIVEASLGIVLLGILVAVIMAVLALVSHRGHGAPALRHRS